MNQPSTSAASQLPPQPPHTADSVPSSSDRASPDEGLGLARLVVVAAQALSGAGIAPAVIAEGRLERDLRTALHRHETGPGPDVGGQAGSTAAAVGAAVRAACAHLGAGDAEEAFLALCTAADRLGYPVGTQQPGP